VLLANK